MTLDLEPIKRRLEASATAQYWQRSWFVNHLNYLWQPDEWKKEMRRAESRTIRGAGRVGTPGCNMLFRVDGDVSDADMELIANAPSDIAALIAEVERGRETPGEADGT